ncbi:SDR family oxidoreductase [Nocardia sp. R6R-6]|uniref:SDR family oxidoreductase n=1 Tax=Nocardia sp. R6R-6 TaxID=3459303 RepID=UPI00403E039C
MSDQHAPQQIPIAVVGIGSLTPGASDTDAFWHTVLRGQDQLTDVPPTHWLIDDYFDPDPAAKDRTYSRRGAFLSAIDFDPAAYGITPNALPATDTAQLLALVVAERVLADLGGNSAREIDRERVSVILGTGALDLLRTMSNRLQRPVWLKAMRELGVPERDAQAICDRIAEHYVPWQEATFPGVLGNVVAGRIANRFDLHGTNMTVDAACASSLAAVAGAVHELSHGTADIVITGGVDTLNDISTYMCFSKTPALSPTGDCRPFSDNADGTMLGEAVVMFALKRLADAERDGDRVYAVIRGIGSSSDGRGSAIYAPVPAGQARALQRAYEAAGYGPDTVGLVEAHGTGTRAGDAAEFTALREVFDSTGRKDRQWCALGSAKSQIGHTKSAAGAVGLLKAVLALQHQVLPPTIKVDRPNPDLDLPASPLYLNTVARPWIACPDYPRRASVSSFGFGGTNFHLTLEEYLPTDRAPGRSAPRARCAPTELILVGAASPEELLTRTRALIDRDGTDRDGDDLAVTAQRSQQEFDPATATARLAVVARDRAHLAERIGHITRLVERDPAGRHTLPGAFYQFGAADPGRVAWLFSGQGSQYVGMGADLAMSVPSAAAAWDRVADMWSTWIDDGPLHEVVFPIPAFDDKDRAAQHNLLTATEWAQPALAAQALAQLAVLRELGMAPDCVGGHSFGELVAVHVAGALNEAGLLRAARRRGELMRDAAGSDDPGAMLALEATRRTVEALLAEQSAEANATVWIANENGPQQIVLSGHLAAIEDLQRRAAAAGITARRLSAAAAFHTPLMAEARAPFQQFLHQLDVVAPQLELYGNADAEPYSVDPDRIKQCLSEHLTLPVRFAAQIEAMYDAGVRTFVEFGAGSVLTGLVGQILGDRAHIAVSLDHRDRHGLTMLQETIGVLVTAGFEANLDVLWAPFREQESRTAPKSRIRVPINGANYGSPYPPTGGSAALPPPNPAPAPSRTIAPAAGETDATMPGPMTAGPTLAPVDSFEPMRGDPGALREPEIAERTYANASAAAPSAAPVGGGADGQWISVFREAQAQTAAAHLEFQRAAIEGHRAFLTSMEKAVVTLAGMASSGSEVQRSALGGLDPAGAADQLLEGLPEHSPVTAPDVRHRDTTARPTASGTDAGPSVGGYLEPRSAAALGDELGSSVPPDSTAGVSVREVEIATALVEVIAEKTGFPPEVVDPYLELEADLGIDSIKRVEILSALRARLPELAKLDVDLTTLGSLRTADQIATAFSTALTGQHARPAPVGNLIDAAAAPGERADAAESAGIARSVSVVVPAPLPGLELPGLRSGVVLVTDDGTGVADHLTDLLLDQGILARVWAAPAHPDGGETRDLVDPDVRGLVVLAGLRPVPSVDDAIEVNHEVFRITRAAAERIGVPGGVLVTVQDTGGDFGLSGTQGPRAWLGGLAGLNRTLRKEWPAVHAKAVDCARGSRDAEALARALADELLAGGSQPDVALGADGARRVLAERPISADRFPQQPPSRSPELIVATGGGRGVTAHALRALVAASPTPPVVALLGRTHLEPELAGLAGADGAKDVRGRLVALARDRGEHVDPVVIAAQADKVLAIREIGATLVDLERAGAVVRYFPVDVRDATGLQVALKRLRSEFGPITGLVHAAGVLADGQVSDKTDAHFAAVVDTKVAGLRALLDATADDPLNLVCVFSSAAARFGNAGQGDYALANEVIAQVASTVQVDRPDCVVRSLAWGPWDGGMVSSALRAHFLGQGTALISPAAGAEAFVREVRGGTGAVRVTLTAGQRPDPFTDAADRGVSGAVWVGRESHPHLADHMPAGRPVVPLAIVAEWFLRAARIRQSQPGPITLRDLDVIRGVELDNFDDGGQLLTIRGRAAEQGELGLDLVGARGFVHVRATVSAGNDDPAPTAGVESTHVSGAVDQAATYRRPVLFHGPAFRAIDVVESLSDGAASAGVIGVRRLGWRDELWQSDPAAVDAALQLALLWAADRSRALVAEVPADGAAYLPMGIAQLRVFRQGPVGAGTRCVLRGTALDSLTARCDVTVVDADGAAVVELLGVRLVRRPDEPAAAATTGADHVR